MMNFCSSGAATSSWQSQSVLMAVLLTLLPDAVARARLKSALRMDGERRARHDMLTVESWAEMREVALHSPVHLTIFDPYTCGKLDLESVRLFHEQFPSVALLAYGDFARCSVRDAVRLVRVGVQEIAIRGEDDNPLNLRNLIAGALTHSVAGVVLAALRDLLPTHLAPLIRQLLSLTNEPLTPGKIAKLYHRHPNTLREHLSAAGLPPVNKLIVWIRLFHVAHLLEHGPRSVENVAWSLGFTSASALRNQLHRYAGLTPQELRVQNGLGLLLTEFRMRCQVGNWAVGHFAQAEPV
jgi:AraC-like DNA-binding protein